MMLRVQRYQFQHVRGLHLTSRRNDFFSWFKSRKQEQVQVQDTKEVIKEVESGKNLDKVSSNSDSARLELIPSNFIGQETQKLKKVLSDKQINEVAFNRWLSNDKVTTQDQLDTILNESWKLVTTNTNASLDQVFPDLVSKFKFAKNLQSRTGYMVPDLQITVFSTPLQFRDYYVKEILSGKALKFKESEPNAIDLSEKDYGSPNVHIVRDISSKEKKKKFGRIIQEVHALEQESLRKTVEEAKRG